MFGVVSKSMDLGETLLLALLGMGIVFFGLILIMVMIRIVAPIVDNVILKRKQPVPVESAAPVAASERVPYDGSLGELSLHSVDDKTAAMIMAILADELKTPLNELRFISIREVNAS